MTKQVFGYSLTIGVFIIFAAVVISGVVFGVFSWAMLFHFKEISGPGSSALAGAIGMLGSGASFVGMLVLFIGQFRARIEVDSDRIRSINLLGRVNADESLKDVQKL